MISQPLFMILPRVLHKKVTELVWGREGDVLPPDQETDINRLAGLGYFCYSGITKCENTEC